MNLELLNKKIEEFYYWDSNIIYLVNILVMKLL